MIYKKLIYRIKMIKKVFVIVRKHIIDSWDNLLKLSNKCNQSSHDRSPSKIEKQDNINPKNSKIRNLFEIVLAVK